MPFSLPPASTQTQKWIQNWQSHDAFFVLHSSTIWLILSQRKDESKYHVLSNELSSSPLAFYFKLLGPSFTEKGKTLSLKKDQKVTLISSTLDCRCQEWRAHVLVPIPQQLQPPCWGSLVRRGDISPPSGILLCQVVLASESYSCAGGTILFLCPHSDCRVWFSCCVEAWS